MHQQQKEEPRPSVDKQTTTGQQPQLPVDKKYTVSIHNITNECPDAMLKQMLEMCGSIHYWKRLTFKVSAICDFVHLEEAKKALNVLNGMQLGDKKLNVEADEATKKMLAEPVNAEDEQNYEALRAKIRKLIEEEAPSLVDLPLNEGGHNLAKRAKLELDKPHSSLDEKKPDEEESDEEMQDEEEKVEEELADEELSDEELSDEQEEADAFTKNERLGERVRILEAQLAQDRKNYKEQLDQERQLREQEREHRDRETKSREQVQEQLDEIKKELERERKLRIQTQEELVRVRAQLTAFGAGPGSNSAAGEGPASGDAEH